MPLLYRVKSRAELPAGFESHYIERDGAFVLDVSGVVEKDKLDEFRSNNKTLNEQLRELTSRFEGIDPAKARELLAKAQELEDAQLVKAGDVEKLIENRLKKLKADLEGKLQAATAERDTLSRELSEIRIDQQVIEAASKQRLRPTAIPDLVSRTRSVFRLVDGQPKALKPMGSPRG
jgi:predicted nuclease with TOPRIM domain